MSRKHREHIVGLSPPMSVVDGGLEHIDILDHLEGAGFQPVVIDGLSSDEIQVLVSSPYLDPETGQDVVTEQDMEEHHDGTIHDTDVMEHHIEDMVDATIPEHLPDPVPRMASDRLQMRIRILRKQCPKQPGSSAARNWALYVDGMTLSAYLANPAVVGGRRRARKDVAWDVDKGHIMLQTEEEWQADQATEG